MDVSVLIPWRPDGGQRDDVFRYLVPLWRATGAEICIGTDSGVGPFNCAQAQNNAFRQASHDRLVMFGADQLPDQRALWAASAMASGPRWQPLFSSTGYYSRRDTADMLAGAACNGFQYAELYPYCEGVIALTRPAYEAAGGMDERFAGWGAEDSAFRHTLKTLYGAVSGLPLTLRCLWHAGEHRVLGPANRALVDEYNAIIDAERMRDHLATRGSFL